MKKISLLLATLLIFVFGVFALASGEKESADQGSGTADPSKVGDYSVIIDSCRLAKDYEGKDIVIVKYNFKNVEDDDAAAFYLTFEDAVYQNGVGLNESYVAAESAKYDASAQTKAIKKGASIDVEVAYELNDNKTDIIVEVSELMSFDDKTITKTFSISK